MKKTIEYSPTKKNKTKKKNEWNLNWTSRSSVDNDFCSTALSTACLSLWKHLNKIKKTYQFLIENKIQLQTVVLCSHCWLEKHFVRLRTFVRFDFIVSIEARTGLYTINCPTKTKNNENLFCLSPSAIDFVYSDIVCGGKSNRRTNSLTCIEFETEKLVFVASFQPQITEWNLEKMHFCFRSSHYLQIVFALLILPIFSWKNNRFFFLSFSHFVFCDFDATQFQIIRDLKSRVK